MTTAVEERQEAVIRTAHLLLHPACMSDLDDLHAVMSDASGPGVDPQGPLRSPRMQGGILNQVATERIDRIIPANAGQRIHRRPLVR